MSLTGIGPLKAGQANLGVTLPSDCIVVLTDSHVLRYIRKGANQNNGMAQTEACLVHADGSIDPSTPLIWDYAAVTEAVAYPISEKTLTLRGGTVTTIANAAPSAYTYYNCGIAVNRSNTVVEGLVHLVTVIGATGAPITVSLLRRDVQMSR